MTLRRPLAVFFVIALCSLGSCFSSSARAAAPAPVLVAPADGASVLQPVTIDWNPVVDPNGAIGSYTWQVGTTNAFTSVVLEGFTNMLFDGVLPATEDMVSGLSNGTYFWRVKATSVASGDSNWSEVRSFKVTGLGAAPGRPTISLPANNSRFHTAETFDIRWSAVANAQYYLLEADDEPTFSYPLALTIDAQTFGTRAQAIWGNEIPNIYYRVRAVSADNVRGLPSKTLTVHITNRAPVAPAPTQVAPAPGASMPLPVLFDWTDDPNPQSSGYSLDVDPDPNFGGAFGAITVEGISRSDYLLTFDFAPGIYFWRVRALHGSVVGPWSPGRALTIAPPLATPPGLIPFYLIASPSAVAGGNSTQARLTLNAPAPAGGALVTLASDLPQANLPGSVLIPQGKTDALVTPVTTTPVSGTVVSTLRATYGGGTVQSSIGLFPLFFATQVSVENVVGGTSFTGTVSLLDPAPAGGTVVRLVSNNTSLLRPPATVSIPEGGTGATFTIATSAVASSVIATIDSGTENDGYHAPRLSVILTPPGGATLPPSLAALTLSPATVLGGSTTTGTVTLTAPAPAGGAVIPLSGSLEGQVVTPPSVTVPAGSTSATFTITAPEVLEKHWVLIQAHYGTFDGAQSELLEIDPAPPGPPVVFTLGVSESTVTAGDSVLGTAGTFAPAPAGGAKIRLTSSNPSVVQVPPSLRIAAGNSANSFAITTSSVPIETSVRIDATLGGVTKSIFVNVEPNLDDQPLLESLTVTPDSVPGGTNAAGTVMLSAPAPAGGIFITLATSNFAVAQVPAVVFVAGGQTTANFTVTTFVVSNDTAVTITGFYGSGVQSDTLTVTKGSAP